MPSKTSSGSLSTISEIGRPFQTFSEFARVALQERTDVEVLIPLGHAKGKVAERVRGDVDAAGQHSVALLCRERPIVADDVRNRIGHLAPSSATAPDAVVEPRQA